MGNSLRVITNGESLIRGVKILISWYDDFGNKKTTSRIFRPLWPLVTPVDIPQNSNPANSVNSPSVNGQNPTGFGQGF